MPARATTESRVDRLAAGQHGLVTYDQALAAGLSPDQIQYRVAARRWVRVARGIYRLPGAPRTWQQRVLAACLTAGEGAVATAQTAAVFWNIDGFRPGPPTILVPHGPAVTHRGFRAQRTEHFHLDDRSAVDGIPVTSVPRTIVELTPVVRPERLERVVDEAVRRKLTTLTEIEERATALHLPGRPSLWPLWEVTAERTEGERLRESELEDALLRLLRKAGLPLPVPQFEVRHRGRLVGRVDYAYVDERISIDTDGFAYHSSKAQWEHDLRRQRWLMRAGWRPYRFGWTDVHRRPAEVVRDLREALAADLVNLERRISDFVGEARDPCG